MSQQEIPNNHEIDQIFFIDGFRLAEDNYTDKAKPSLLFKGMMEQYNSMEQLIDSFSQRCTTDGIKIDCKSGCSYCCNKTTFALAHEILLIAVYMHQNLSKDEIKVIRRKAEENLSATKELTKPELINFKAPCPLLKKGKCSVYAVRPMTCRTYLSQDVQTCKSIFTSKTSSMDMPQLFDFVLRAGRNMNEGFVARLNEIGLKPTANTIELGLHATLSDPEALLKFIKDEEIFPAFGL